MDVGKETAEKDEEDVWEKEDLISENRTFMEKDIEKTKRSLYSLGYGEGQNKDQTDCAQEGFNAGFSESFRLSKQAFYKRGYAVCNNLLLGNISSPADDCNMKEELVGEPSHTLVTSITCPGVKLKVSSHEDGTITSDLIGDSVI